MFVDKATIHIIAGKGGNGAVAFHREKYVASGGPDGGDGGKGGNIVLVPDPHMSTLMDFRFKRKYRAENGADGTGKRCSGKAGEDLIIKVPHGTVVRDPESGAVMADLSDGKPFIAARGGIGGWGNAHFATPTRQAPRFAKAGLPGVERDIILELKLLADVGLLGFPNVGKSTLLSVVSKAHPKIANYHFTTLFPNLGVIFAGEDSSFIMADIPGIIEGASEGAGLGHDFLRHVDRCRLLVHVVDVSGCEGRDPIEDFEIINSELKEYSEDLASRPMLVAANKCDIADEEAVERFEKYITEKGLPFFRISAAAHMGTKELVSAIAYKLKGLPPIITYEPDFVEPEGPTEPEEPTISREDGVWYVDGGWVEQLVQNINFGDYESRMYFDRIMRTRGLFDKLEEMGVTDGDTVCVCGMQFDYQT